MPKHRRVHHWFLGKLRAQITYRTPILLVILLFFIGIFGYGYYSIQYITNKGPADFWTQSYTAAYLRYKFGEMSKGDGMRNQITDFKPDQPNGKSGLYTIKSYYKGQNITVQTYYDRGKYYNWTNFPTNPVSPFPQSPSLENR